MRKKYIEKYLEKQFVEKSHERKMCYICEKEIDEFKPFITLLKDPKTGINLHRHWKCKPTGKLKPIREKK